MSYIPGFEKASIAFQRGDHRRSATEYLHTFTGIANKFDSPRRWHAFHGFTSILQEEYFAASDSDIVALKKVAENNHEAKLYRVEAYFTLGLLLFIRRELDKSADYYREAIRIADKTPDKERKKDVAATMTDLRGKSAIGLELRKVGDIVDVITQHAKRNLHIMENFYSLIENPSPPNTAKLVRSDGTVLPPVSTNSFVKFGPSRHDLTKERLERLLTVGGDKCDCCYKTRQELGLKILDKCSRCLKAYYCSADCQTKQWKAGHKIHCRMPGQIEPGDYVRLRGIQSRPELNDNLVQVIAADPKKKGRWEIRMPGGNSSISVATEKIEQLRPMM